MTAFTERLDKPVKSLGITRFVLLSVNCSCIGSKLKQQLFTVVI